jgi:hypothetical protein
MRHKISRLAIPRISVDRNYPMHQENHSVWFSNKNIQSLVAWTFPDSSWWRQGKLAIRHCQAPQVNASTRPEPKFSLTQSWPMLPKWSPSCRETKVERQAHLHLRSLLRVASSPNGRRLRETDYFKSVPIVSIAKDWPSWFQARREAYSSPISLLTYNSLVCSTSKSPFHSIYCDSTNFW